MFKPSHYQEAIFDFIQNGEGNGLVQAVAGSGKSTTLVHGAKLVDPSDKGLFVAFNKHIVTELDSKLEDTPMQAKTVHSIGYGCIRQIYSPSVNATKYLEILDSWVENNNYWHLKKYLYAMSRIVDLARLTLVDEQDYGSFWWIASTYGIDYEFEDEDLIFEGVAHALRKGLDRATYEIDFTDMLYIPYKYNLQPRQVDWVFADEAQDFSPAQLDLIMKLSKGRYLFVGDRSQSIMGFGGADTRSMDKIKAKTNAQEFPLSICYRCPTKHIELAQTLVPHIEAREGAPEGVLGVVYDYKFESSVKDGDLILSRTTAPLVEKCIELIKHSRSAKVRGNDISGSLTSVVQKVAKQEGYTYQSFLFYLKKYQEARIEKLKKKKFSGGAIRRLNDVCTAVEVCYTAFNTLSEDDLCAKIESVFQGNSADIWLSSVHRAKGLQNDRVIILEPEKMPLQWEGQSPEDYQQELNVQYVAFTRSKDELYFVKEINNV